MGGELLVIAVPGLGLDLGNWREMETALRECGAFAGYAACHWEIFDHGMRPQSRTPLAPVARRLEAWIADRWEDHGRPEHVILAAHSAGGLLVRRAWLHCVADRSGASDAPDVWGDHVRRFVLFAGLSRGAQIERSFRWRLASRIVEFIPGTFSFEECLPGSAFITNLRIDWMRHVAGLDPTSAPEMVELLGTEDPWVDEGDSGELTFLTTGRPIPIGGADHGNLHHLAGVTDRAARLRRFAQAMTGPVSPRQAADSAASRTGDVLLIVHGIRASKVDNWVKQAEAAAARLWPGVVAVVPTYGTLSALGFALPNVRRRYGRYFRDFYTEAMSKHRPARISALCHSNGTYALGHSLTEFESMRLERVALAGSVLPTRYDWGGLIRSRRVKAVRNDGGASDVPVAILCSGLRGLLMRDVGTGGFDGFHGSGVTEVLHHDGGHGAMLSDANLESMIRFLKGEAAPLPGTQPARGWVRRLSRLMGYVAPLLALGLLALAGYLAWTFGLWGVIVFLTVVAMLWILLDVV